MLKKRIASFGFAAQGLRTLLKTQPNARIHLLATIVVGICAFVLDVTRTDWLLLIMATGMVWTAEAFNTALEFLTDLVSPGFHELAGKTKDVAAAAVFLASLAAALIGVLVFTPYVLRIL